MAIQEILHLLIVERDRLNQAIAALQGSAPRKGRPATSSVDAAGPAASTRRGRTFTPAQRKKQAERMKAYWAARRKEK